MKPPPARFRPLAAALLLLRPGQAPAARDPMLRVLIRHGVRGEAPLQAEALRGWLTALAIESSRVERVNDLGAGERLMIEVAGRR